MIDQDTRFLPFFLREPVYVVPETAPTPKETPQQILAHQGQGKQQVLVVVRETDYPFLAPDDQAFLAKILSAVSLSEDDIWLVNWQGATAALQQGVPLEKLLPEVPYQKCIVFGEMPAPWSLTNFFEPYEVKKVEEKWLLQAETLAVLTNYVEKKAKFWKGLQQLFGLS